MVQSNIRKAFFVVFSSVVCSYKTSKNIKNAYLYRLRSIVAKLDPQTSARLKICLYKFDRYHAKKWFSNALSHLQIGYYIVQLFTNNFYPVLMTSIQLSRNARLYLPSSR